MTPSLPATQFDKVNDLIEAELGLRFPASRRDELDRGLFAAATALGYASVDELAKRLLTGTFDRRHADALAAQLTVGETYFFRDPASFEALTWQILPELVRERRATTRHIRCWSAGCSSGEEAYSLAITLRRAIPDIDHWRISILATDINPRALQKAHAGIYGQWSFRGVSEEARKTWFRELADGRYEIQAVIREMVTFDYLNLVEDVYPALANQTNAMDLILCRNVLMYLSPLQMDKVVAKFHRALVDGGTLMVSATEASQETFRDFTPLTLAGALIYQKGSAPTAASLFANSGSAFFAEEASPPPSSAPTPEPPKPSPPPLPATPRDYAAEARLLANQGNFAAALHACDCAIAGDKLQPGMHYLRGIILQEQGQGDAAIGAMQRALYLDPDFAMGYFTLGHLFLRKGLTQAAERCFANTRNLLKDCAPDLQVPESEGLTAGRLLAILHSTEKSLA